SRRRSVASTRPKPGSAPAELQALTNRLQEYIYRPSLLPAATETISPTATITAAVVVTPTLAAAPSPTATITATIPIPLFIALDHEGNGYPHSPLSPPLTDVPGGMALGATWNPDYAARVGAVVGRELAAEGINMLFGPVLDVVDKPGSQPTGVSGVRAFGGDPYWVGAMGRAYIRGAHTGSNGQVLTIAKHFPGAGSIDRRLNQDIPTIQKLFEQLQLVELAPFYAVTTAAATPEVTDGLMTAHIRYRGLQGNIRDLTKPISLDPQNMPGILASLAPWQESGGLIVSGPLGVPAVTKTYKADEGDFPARRIALDAFLAGSDLLLLAQFGPPDDFEAQFETIVTTLEFFQNKYQTDPIFQQRVDVSVRRIIQAKLKLYGDNFNAPNVLRTPDALASLAETPANLVDVVRDSVTLIYPDPAELADRIPSPPLRDETIVIFTDDRQARLCPDCSDFYLIDPTALQQAMLNRYGPDASDQISPGQIFSFTFTELADTLAGNTQTTNRNAEINALLRQADWIIFAMLDVDEARYPASGAVKQFLRESNLDLRDKKVIVLAFDAPYYLDNTEVSILTAYYGLYNKTGQHIEAAARLLFKEFGIQGHAPVSIDAVEYNLPSILEPDPDQVIVLEYFQEPPAATPEAPPPTVTTEPAGEGTPQPVAVEIEVGDRLLIRTGLIVDRNGNPVPDNTLVSFNRTYPQEGLQLAPITEPTINGVAQTMITVDREGTLEITVESGEATRSGRIIIEGPTSTPHPLPCRLHPPNPPRWFPPI
ncbi:MAG: glycoside hydrolase family 3 N-terminal domain-containing protein, partial [Anaerolineae bacterium]